MCPVCVSTVAAIAIGATSAGGLAALFMKLRAGGLAMKIARLAQHNGD